MPLKQVLFLGDYEWYVLSERSTKSQFVGTLHSSLRQKLQTIGCNWSCRVEGSKKHFLQKLSRDSQGPFTPCLTNGNTHVQGTEGLELSNLLGVGEGTCELLLWEEICSPFTNTSWTTLGEKRCETVDWVCWLLGARCAGPTRMLLRNSVTLGAWEQHRNSTEKNREKEKEQEGGMGQREREDRKKGKRGEREREEERERFVTLPFTKSSKLIHD